MVSSGVSPACGLVGEPDEKTSEQVSSNDAELGAEREVCHALERPGRNICGPMPHMFKSFAFILANSSSVSTPAS